MKLREVVESDLEVFFHHQADPETKAMSGHPGREREAYFEHMRVNVLPQGHDEGIIRAIEVDGQLVGNVLAWFEDEKWLLGYVLGRQWWGRGIASQAVAELLRLIPHARPVFAEVSPGNAGSRRVLEKNGFELVSQGAETLDFKLAG
jgi:RimJ/RimL family protein N-acetyltransferase